MAFNYRTFQRWSTGDAFGANAQWQYTTDEDTLAETEVAGYFDSVSGGNPQPLIKAGDLIWVVASDTAAFLKVTSTSGTVVVEVVVGANVHLSNLSDVALNVPLDLPDDSTAVTQAQSDGSDKIATTDYVDTAVASAGGANVHLSNLDTPALNVPLDLPDNSTAVTQDSADDSTLLATTAFVQAVAGGGGVTNPLSADLQTSTHNIKFGSAGGGSVTTATPSTASNLTMTLPVVTGTLVSSGGSVYTSTAQMIANQTTLSNRNTGTSHTLLMPVTSAVGDYIRVVVYGSVVGRLVLNAGQTIVQDLSSAPNFVDVPVLTGVHLVCTVANTQWVVVSTSGTLSFN